jgi:alkane 1-monooxygenase
MWKYLKFGWLNWIVTLGTAVSFVLGGWWMWFGVGFMFIIGVGGELLSKEDNSEPGYSFGWIYDWIIYTISLFLVVSLITFVWAFSGADLLGIGAFAQQFGYDALAARGENAWYHYTGAALSMGITLGVQGIVMGHELVSRTEDAVDTRIGELVFALMFGTNFAVEHVYGHHKNLGYPEHDAVTPIRGSHFYQFQTVGTWTQWKSGWDVEKRRLNDAGKSVFSLENRIVQAWLRGGIVMALVLAGGGWVCFLYYLLAICYAKFILEGLNFFSHYGLVREKGQPITPRVTFSSNNAWGNWILLNLGRHGAHHADNSRYQDLRAYKDDPQCPFGYLTMTVIAWIPPLFFKVIVPMLKEWDEKYATAAELELTRKENQESGIKELENFEPQRMASA